jgi:periplasmic protein CpxP/Spy
MKRIMIGVLMSVMAMSTYAQKQERVHKSPEEIAAKRAEHMKSELGLSDEQTKKVEAAWLVKMTKSKDLRTTHADNKETLKKEMRPVHQAFRTSMKEILTKEQFAKWQENKKKERKDKSPEEKAAMRAAHMRESLGLTDEQTAKVESAVLTKMTKSKEIRAKYPEDKDAAKKELKPIHAQFEASMKEILTPEQFAKWKEMKKSHPKKGDKRKKQEPRQHPVK